MTTENTAQKEPSGDIKENPDAKRKIMPYPLYDELLTLVNDENSKISENKLAMTMNSANEKQSEILYSLIYHHYLLETTDKEKINEQAKTLPYEAKENEKNHTVTFNVANLPATLKQILFLYMMRCK